MQYTVISEEELKTLVQQYKLGVILSYKVLSGGSENTNYLLNTVSGSFVLTICEQKSINEAKNLSLLLEFLGKSGFETSAVLRNKDEELVSEYKGKPVILKTFLEGKTIEVLPNSLIKLIGVQMGALHKIKPPEYLPTSLSYGIEHFDEVVIYAKDSLFHKWLREIKLEIAPYFLYNIPRALIHSDIFDSNVIVNKEGNSVKIMDFEEAANYYRIFDLGMAIVGLCRDGESINQRKVSSLLNGYSEEVRLTTEEQKALQPFTLYAAAAMSFWRHKNFNHTNPTLKLKNHYMELKNVAEHIRKLPKNQFMKSLNDTME